MTPLVEDPVKPGERTADLPSRDWDVWTCAARLVVTPEVPLAAAHDLVQGLLAEVDAAASRFRRDSEVRRIAASGRGEREVSPLLAWLIRCALQAAARTGGDVDPTVTGAADRAAGVPPVRWTDVRLVDRTLSLPPGTLLDLGATGKAAAADLCATSVTATFGGGALVSLGGDLRVAGEDPPGGWHVLARDAPGEPECVVQLTAVRALATSSTMHRRGPAGHHILRPGDGKAADEVWRTVSVAAQTCRQANTFATAALVRGEQGADLLRTTGLPARLVSADGRVVCLNGWPQ